MKILHCKNEQIELKHTHVKKPLCSIYDENGMV